MVQWILLLVSIKGKIKQFRMCYHSNALYIQIYMLVETVNVFSFHVISPGMCQVVFSEKNLLNYL